MSVVVFGINHRTAPLEIRETLWLSSDEVRSVITDFKAHYFSECFLVSTCNRTELYGVIDEKVTPSPAHVLAELQKRFLTMKAVSVVRECGRIPGGEVLAGSASSEALECGQGQRME